MASPTPQKLTHRGTVMAEAFLLSASILSESEMRRRVVEHWQAGEEVFRRGNDLILILREALRVKSDNGLGLPFVRYGKSLAAFPIEKKDQKCLPDVRNSLILLSAGDLEIIHPVELKAETIEEWFDISDFCLTEMESLGSVEPLPPRIMDTVSDEDLDLRSELKTVPRPDPQLADILEKLREFKSANDTSRSGSLFSKFHPSK